MHCAPDIVFTPARDGSPSAKLGGKWLAGCSVPRRAAELMLRKLAVKGNLACLLLPTHAQQVVVCLQRLPADAALLVLATDEAAVHLMRQVADLEDDLDAGRLFFAHDDASLVEIFDAHPGLPVPQQFVRLPITPQDLIDSRIKSAQAVFSQLAQRRALERAATAWRPSSGRVCVAASLRFRLWDDAGFALASALDADVINLDDPRQTAPHHIAQRASSAAALLTVNSARADHRDLLPPDLPWLAWITQARVPAYLRSSPQDGLLLADEQVRALARNAGWPDHRLVIACPPRLEACPAREPTLALLANLPDLAPPAEIEDYSSWRVVWDAIAKDLLDHPQHLAGDIDGYLEKSRRHFGVPAENFPQATFIDRLIAPAYTIGIARWLTREYAPVAIYGNGWDRIDSVRSRGVVNDRATFETIVGTHAGLVDSFIAPVHPVRQVGRPVLATVGRTPQRILQDLRGVLSGRAAVAPASTLGLSHVRALLPGEAA